MAKRPSLFGNKAASSEAVADEPRSTIERAQAALHAADEASKPEAIREAISMPRYPKTSTREGERVVTAYIGPEAFRP